MSLSLGPSVRKGFSLGLERSPDPDILGWTQFRYEYGKRAKKSNINFQRPFLRSSDFHARFQHAIRHIQQRQPFRGRDSPPHSALTHFELLEKDLEPVGLPWVRPNGNFEALVGFALEDILDTELGSRSNAFVSIPRQLQDSGWNITNSLTWAANPVQRDLTKMTQSFCSTQRAEAGAFRRFNESIIQHSGLRVVLMCGRAVQDLVLPTGPQETRLKLEVGEFPMFLDMEDEAIKRIYILVPNPVEACLLREWRKIHELSEVLHFTAAITSTAGIRPYAGDNGCVLTKIIRDCIDEGKGIQAPLTLDTLHPMTRLWLTRRVFARDEDIARLQEKGGGSLNHAMLVLLHVAPSHVRNVPTTFSMSSFYKSKERHAPVFKIDRGQLQSIQDLCDQLSQKLPVDVEHPSDDLIQKVKSGEEELEEEIGKADVLERENLESSEICVDDHGTFSLFADALVTPWQKKKPRVSARDRSFTVGDKTREELLQGRKYLGTRTKRHNSFVVTIHSCIELFLHIENPPKEAIVKAEIKPPEQRHPHVWAREALATDSGSRLAFCVTYTSDGGETSSYITSNLVQDLYRANSFVHWMEGEDVASIITRPRQFVVVSSLTRMLPSGIPRPGSFYTNDHTALIPAKEFDPRKKHKLDAV